ncbi:clathrin associated protein complex large subunit, gamma-adaptin [Scheffersomyces amazonensis]|uniref:clathrin associated protein complex large subunit, gamma-adaptin n=1 Tax=Scheffersomyces amazonensis TaxID=1078765 RepID=UPI00315D920C
MASLKSFIKAVRKAKTIADERAVVRKESALIRTSFRDAGLDQTTRRINISKLLYLYIMGEKTHFGQVECLKLLASPRFLDKRLGYLAAMLLLDENQEVLTLLTNSLDNDMQHPNAYIVGLALSCLGNIASPELARDLYTNVETIMTSNNGYLKKKACIVAAKLVEKDPELSEFFLNKIPQLINDKSSSTLLGAVRLMESIYINNEDDRSQLIKYIPKIIGHLKRVTTSGYMPDYDVGGVTDPFLQVNLLSLLRILANGDGNQTYAEDINDILTQVASNLESGKNSANAVLYECVKTIFTIPSDQSLKILGVNLLGKFLSTKDNNTRYVALDTLLSVINIEPLAVQRHRSTIVNCLSDGDISIRRRALELSFAILNDQNIRVLVREILTFLETSGDNELKSYVTSQLTLAANKYSPNDKWHFDTLIRMLKVSGNFVTSDIISNILALILQCNDIELKRHIISSLLGACLEDSTQFGLSIITIWSIGEYADLILNQTVEIGEKKSKLITESVILQLIDELINNTTYSQAETTQLITYILTAVIKLSIKFKDSQSIESLRLILNARTYDNNLEIQIRALEYQEIFAQDTQLKKGLLARMPAPPLKERESLSLHATGSVKKSTSMGSATNGSGPAVPPSTDDLLLDLLDDNNSTSATNSTNQNELLSDIFGSNTKPARSNNDAILDLFNTPASNVTASTSTTSNSTTIPSIEAYANSHVRVLFTPKSFPQNGTAVIESIIESHESSAILEQVQLLIAVPKSQKLTITSTSGDTVSPGQSIKQTLKLVGKAGAKIKLRVKVRYGIAGSVVDEQFDFAGFEHTL